MFIKEPVLGMRDILPGEMEARELLLGKLKRTYSSFGYSLIDTPCIEHLENMTGRQGGENEKLIFKILMRGEKLVSALESGDPEALADSALRYDLTVPLARYYASNSGKLPLPFKAMQIGSAWRADRPQKGRFRQFTQCDIDILGDPANNAEIELIYVTSLFLRSAGVGNCTVMINDRRLLMAMALKSGFAAEDFGRIFIILDKYDKIGLDGVEASLLESGFPADKASAYIGFLDGMLRSQDRFSYCERELEGVIEPGVIANLREITQCVDALSDGSVNLDFDPWLVRGMAYYTGVIFEIRSDELGGSSIAGGGRYDEMVGKYTGQQTPACGFSIGFERMVSMLLERGGGRQGDGGKLCVLYDKAFDAADITRLQKKCMQIRSDGGIALVQRMKKNLRNQIEALESDGYTRIIKLKAPDEIEALDI